jgi:hypothetical protein
VCLCGPGAKSDPSELTAHVKESANITRRRRRKRIRIEEGNKDNIGGQDMDEG